MSDSTPTRHGAGSWMLLAILSLIWGSSFVLMKKGLEGFDALQLGLIRISVAALCLAPFALRYIGQLSRRELGMLVIVGLTGNALPALLYAQSEVVLPSAVVGVLTSLTPLFALIIGRLFFGARFPMQSVIGITIGLIGAIILASAASPEADRRTNLAFSLFVVLATVSYGTNLNLVRTYFAGRDSVFVTAIALSAVGWPALLILLTCTSFVHTLHTNPAAPTALVYIAILGALGTAFSVLLFNKLLQTTSIVFASSVTYTIPIVAVLWGFVLNEPFTAVHAAGFCVIFAGVWMTNRRRAAAAPPTGNPAPELTSAA